MMFYVRILVWALWAACLGSMATRCDADPGSSAPPNVIVFLVDDMGVMDTSLPFLTDADGQPKRYPLNDYYRTPNMEQLADHGIRFSNFYAMSVCSPTRISIMTGKNAARHHTTTWIAPEANNGGKFGPPQWNWSGLRTSDSTLPRMLQSAGYRTIHIGKGHFGPFDSEGEEPLNLGFDINVAGCAIGAPGSYFGNDHYGNKKATKGNGKKPNQGRNRAVPHLTKYFGTETFLTDALTLEAKATMTDAVEAKTPFFLYMAHYAVHSPHQSDPRYADHYVSAQHPERHQNFATLVEGMDKSLGELMAHIRELGIAENTLVLFLGDNGSDAPIGHEHAVACAAPLRGKKGSHYEGGMRVPFIAAWGLPDENHPMQKRLPIRAGAIQSAMGNVCDLLPTIVELVGMAPSTDDPINDPIDGTSLRKLLSGEPDPSHSKKFLMHFPHEHRTSYFTSYRNGDWKVIHHDFPGKDSNGAEYELFNLVDDPFEQVNLATSKPVELKRMMNELIESLREHEAQYVVGTSGQPVSPKPVLTESVE
ncbi:Arylsulfatase [Rubripirellula tenax]|uniref:Arylsulfatase n=1 Tax=Rubripirellula tenax TaxID=2528015 RepID=A0A5C6FE68_9BACT|nr:sulfatase-like hydrolase/transferase [Rubripirellula tenax]TWU58890.1 Arylsulfatase [Rubripirellula tenax]